MRGRPRKRPGYYVELLHQTPKGEQRRTLVRWDMPQRSRKRLAEFVMRLESHLAFIRADVGQTIGYTPRPYAANIRNGITERVVASWQRAA